MILSVLSRPRALRFRIGRGCPESGYPQEKERLMPAFTSIKAKAIGIAVDQGVNMLYDDFDGNLPKVESLIN